MKGTNNQKKIYTVYIDEAGQTPYYNDKQQPVLTLVGVVTRSEETHFNQKVNPY